MTAYLTGALFGAAFSASLCSLVLSVRQQAHRFGEILPRRAK
jgi:hypothetical protein